VKENREVGLGWGGEWWRGKGGKTVEGWEWISRVGVKGGSWGREKEREGRGGENGSRDGRRKGVIGCKGLVRGLGLILWSGSL